MPYRTCPNLNLPNRNRINISRILPHAANALHTHKWAVAYPFQYWSYAISKMLPSMWQPCLLRISQGSFLLILLAPRQLSSKHNV